MSHRETEHLRVLIANERKDRLALVAPIVAALGHEVIAREIEVEDVAAVTARERPDVALVGLGESSEHALHMVERLVHEAACPVIVLIHTPDPAFVKEASKRGVFAYITDADAMDWQSSIDIVLRRFTEYHDLEGAFGRRAVTERAKGILMERHSIDEPTAFELLREHARSTNRKVVDVESAVVDGTACCRSSHTRLRRLTGRKSWGPRLQTSGRAGGLARARSRAKRGVGNGSEAEFSTTLSMGAHAPETGRLVREKNGLFCRDFVKPSDGLEPSTPSLPWRCSTN
jgi:AmiR/NasT family two-component response regulator